MNQRAITGRTPTIKPTRRDLLRWTAGASALGAAAALPRWGVQAQGAATGEIVIGQPSPFQFMDPQRTYLSSEASTHRSIFDTLVGFDDQAQMIPLLATEWSVTGDAEWTFTLRQGVTFHNGEPFTADSVKYNIDRVIVPGFQDYAFMAPVAGAEVVDEYTVKILTKGVFPTLARLLAQFFIVSPQAMEQGVDTFVEQPIGTGPYTFVEWSPDDHVTVVANEGYWGGVPTIKDVTWRVLPEASTRLAALQAGEIQVMKDLTSDQWDQIANGDGTSAVEVRSARTPYLRFFPESPQGGGEPFNDVRVRQAFNHAINVDSIIANLLGGHAERTATIMTPDIFGFDPSVQPYPYDPERAIALLTEAGYGDGFEIDFDTFSAGPAPKPLEVTQAVAADLAKINVTANVTPADLGTLLEAQVNRTLSPFGLWSWGGAGFDGDTKFWGVFHTDSSSTFLTDQTMVDLINQERSTTDEAQRQQIFAQLQQHVVEQAYIVPLFAQMDMYGLADNVEWSPRPDELMLPFDMRLAE